MGCGNLAIFLVFIFMESPMLFKSGLRSQEPWLRPSSRGLGQVPSPLWAWAFGLPLEAFPPVFTFPCRTARPSLSLHQRQCLSGGEEELEASRLPVLYKRIKSTQLSDWTWMDGFRKRGH